LERVKALHGHAVLWDCHSIRSVIPFLFPGTLPDLNIGTNGGLTCHPVLERATAEACRTSDFPTVLNGRFKGGWTTRYYGHPGTGIHAIQMETAQSAYLETETAPWVYSEAKAERLRPLLARILNELAQWRPR
jgi:formiminoglutamase